MEREEIESSPGSPTTGFGAYESQISEQDAEFERLLMEWRRTGDPRLRERLILMYQSLVQYLARRFTGRGEMLEDLVQQGMIGLIQALDHFDPARGVRFTSFATPTIVGEIQRYLRDKLWSIRVPRRMQELYQIIQHKIETLTQELHRSPSYGEIARALDLGVEEVIEVLELGYVLEPLSLDEVTPVDDESSSSIADQVGTTDPHLENWGNYTALHAALEKLPEKQREVLEYIYFKGCSQAETARRMQVSQMHVSRLVRRALDHLRHLMEEEET